MCVCANVDERVQHTPVCAEPPRRTLEGLLTAPPPEGGEEGGFLLTSLTSPDSVNAPRYVTLTR